MGKNHLVRQILHMHASLPCNCFKILGAAMMVYAQGTFVLGHKFGTQTFWPEVRESKATIIQYVGEMCRYLHAAPPSPHDKYHSVKKAFGNGMRPDVWNRFRDRFGVETIAELYAATGLPSMKRIIDSRGKWCAIELQFWGVWRGQYRTEWCFDPSNHQKSRRDCQN